MPALIGLLRALRLRCPHCGETAIFPPLRKTRSLSGWFTAEYGCPRCAYRFEREPGYFLMATWATGFFPPALLGVALMLLLPLWFKMSDTVWLAACMIPAALLAVVIARHARAIFLWIDHLFDPPDEAERKKYYEGG